MLNFEIHNPTQLVFGKGQLDKLVPYIQNHYAGKKILVAYGGGSSEKTGLLDRVVKRLEDYQVTLFKGIEANPEFTTLMKAVEIIRKKEIGFILAVGGGSVIDGVKFISGAVNYPGDPWDALIRKEGALFGDALPFGTILTLPATGSEANSGAVISRSEIQEKRTMSGPQFFPRFSFLDPTVVATLPQRQIANGIADAYVHVLEQYLTYPTGNLLQERQAEAILATLIEIAPAVVQNPGDYKAASNLMWCATQALNGNLRCGVPTDWVTHLIGHELTAFLGIDHARTLAIIAPRLFEVKFVNKKQKLAQYGKRVWKLSGSEDDIAKEAIIRTEAFFHSLDIETKISAYAKQSEGIEIKVRERFESRGWEKLGEHQDLTYFEVEEIVRRSI